MKTLYRCSLAALALATLVLGGCASGPTVRAEYDKSIDFTPYKTFGFFDPLGTDRSGYGTIVSQYLKVATRSELEARGMRYDATAPQLRVNFNGILRDKLQSTTMPGPTMNMGYYGYRGSFYSPWPAYPYNTTTVTSTYTEGTLNIDVVDDARKQLVWEGVVVGTVNDTSVDSIKPVIDGAVKAAFARYPVAPVGAAK